MFDEIGDRSGLLPGQRISGAHHHHQLVAKDGADNQARRLDGQSQEAYLDGAVLEFFGNFVAEISVDVDLDGRIAAAEFRKDVG